MLSILFNWLYIAFTAFCLGQAFCFFVEKKLGYHVRRLHSVMVAGLVAATVYAQVFSLFYKVGFLANVLLLLFCFLVLIVYRKRVREEVCRYFRECSHAGIAVAALLILVWAYFTSRGYLVYDSDLYHGQSIRWIEEYGVVKGLGNLHVRFAYNSSVFSLSALYSMKFLLGRSLHTISGFFALILSIATLDIARAWKRKKMLLSDFARAAAIYYLTIISKEVVSPSSDYVVMCIIFFIAIKWLEQTERKKEDISAVPYALLCVCGVYAVTLKLTAGLILVITLKPAVMLIKEKRYKEIAMYLCMGLLTAAPWVTRTVLISGWLLYPFPQLDLFAVDWKIHAERAAADAAEIKTWGRALYNAALVDMPVSGWFPGWFSTTLSVSEKLLILADIAGAILFFLTAAYTFLKRKWENLDYLLLMSAVLLSYVFWQLSAPLLRYGYAYVLLLAALTAGHILEGRKWSVLLYGLMLIYGGYKLFVLTGSICENALTQAYIWQQDYGVYDLKTYELNGETFYYPVTGDRTGYDSFPAVPVKIEAEFRGEGIRDGFRMAP